MGLLFYWRDVFVRSAYESWRTMIKHSWRDVLRDAILLGVTFAIAFWANSALVKDRLMSADNTQDTLAWAIIVLSALGTLLLVTFLAHLLFITPYRMWREASGKAADDLQKGIFIWTGEVERKALDNDTPFVEVRFYAFNGSGVPVELGNAVHGLARLRARVLPQPVVVTGASLSYPGHGTFGIYLELSKQAIADAQALNETPGAKALDTMFDAPVHRHMAIDFSEVRFEFSARGRRPVLVPAPMFVEVRY